MTGRNTPFAAVTFILFSALGSLLSAQNQAPPATNTPTPPPSLDARIMDTTADPCIDFGQYACGNFSKLYPVPYDHSEYDPSTIVAEYTETVLHNILETAAADGAKRSPVEQKIGDYYASCVATEEIDQIGLKPLQPDLARIAALKSKVELPELLAHFQLINVRAFFTFGEQKDFRDARQQIAGLDQGGLGLPERDFYLRYGRIPEKTRAQYIRHISKMLRFLGEPLDNADDDAQKIMQLETALAGFSMDVTSRRDPNNVHHMMSMSQLATLAPGIAWDRFLKATGAPPVSELNVANPSFFKGLVSLLASTDLETVKTYLRWQLSQSVDGLALPQSFDDENYDFYIRKLRGQTEARDRWKRCVQATSEALGEALGQVYITQEFPTSNSQDAHRIAHDIEAAMDQDLDSLSWMSRATKARAKEKLHAVADKIGFPDHWRDYSHLSVVRGDALGNYWRAVEFENRRLLAKIGEPVDFGEWSTSPTTVNAYYSPDMNDLNFPAAFLQPPYYDRNATDAENYGHLGSAIGHELTHGFDDEGRQFEAHGNLADWWTPADAKRFEGLTDCFAKAYGSSDGVEDPQLNRRLTLGEDVADNGGLRLAYIAFLADAKHKSIDVTKKQEGYTALQQFFLGYAQNWCGSTRPEVLRLRAQTDPHSSRQLRINVVLQNIPEFSQAFGCNAGQPMMPTNACRVW